MNTENEFSIEENLLIAQASLTQILEQLTRDGFDNFSTEEEQLGLFKDAIQKIATSRHRLLNVKEAITLSQVLLFTGFTSDV
ncbi:MAG: hypothetical protein KIT27_10275 [Legionellales bacterium]|nr:hypothetical protein [Legionellales bacterium]